MNPTKERSPACCRFISAAVKLSDSGARHLLIEQIPSFSSLTVPDKYLVVSEKLPHTPVVLPTNQGESLEKIRQVAQDYQTVKPVINNTVGDKPINK